MGPLTLRHAILALPQAHFLGPSDGPWWAHVLTVVEAPPLSLFLALAFPASELPAAGPGQSPPHQSDDEGSRLLHAH